MEIFNGTIMSSKAVNWDDLSYRTELLMALNVFSTTMDIMALEKMS